MSIQAEEKYKFFIRIKYEMRATGWPLPDNAVFSGVTKCQAEAIQGATDEILLGLARSPVGSNLMAWDLGFNEHLLKANQ